MEASLETIDLDLNLALKLKDKHPEHFQNLVRMHLSFALDLNIDEGDDQTDKTKSNPTKWSFCKKVKVSKDMREYYPLSELGIDRIHKLILYLSKKENVCQEGIFRRTGALTRQLQLKTCLNEGVTVNFDDNNFSVHDCASVLKNYLSELPEPLVTDVYYPLYCQISEWCKCSQFEARLLRTLQLLILLFPSSNALLLKYVINLLHLTSKHAEQNKMSAENLSTLFTPHILCPRKLMGEELHSNAQMLYQIVVFMIHSGPELFKIPAGLAADIRLYWHEKEKKRLSPKNCLNESTADSCIVNTVFSFVDREKTAQENVTNPTETALAQLYAHIQSLPESSKKRKLVKQFNKENGYGTPKRVLLNNNDKPHSLTRNISDSLKKHIFTKNTRKQDKLVKCSINPKYEQINSTPESRFKSHPLKMFDKRLDCMECGYSDTSDETNLMAKKTNLSKEFENNNGRKQASSTQDYQYSDVSLNENNADLDSVSIRERNICLLSETSNGAILNSSSETLQISKIHTIKEPDLVRKNSDHCKLRTPTISNVKAVSSHFHGTLTSTPAPVYFPSDVLTPSPFCGSNEDMSPITMSAKKMPISMQEVMMTPRSRRPVLAVSGSNTTNLLTKDKTVEHNVSTNQEYDMKPSKSQSVECEHFETCIESCRNNSSDQLGDSLTDTFREYLCSRRMLTTSIVDDSFSSRTGDFDPSSVSEEKLSDSLLYCLDGGTPVQDTSGEYYKLSNKNDIEDEKSLGYNDINRVHETLL